MKLLVFFILSLSVVIVFYWFISEITIAIRNHRSKKCERNKIIAKNIMTYIEYFHDIPLELQQELIESELNNPFLN